MGRLPSPGDGPRGSLLSSHEGWHDRLPLSPRECEIARLVARDFSNKRIARTLDISVWTVSTHLRRIFLKLDVHTKAGMVARILDELARERMPPPPPPPMSTSPGLPVERETPASGETGVDRAPGGL